MALGHYALTDDPEAPAKWRFPDRVLEEGEYAVVFASGKEKPAGHAELHASFRLEREAGGYLALVEAGEGSPVSVFAAYPRQREGVSFGRYGDATDPLAGYFEEPTPGAANGPGILGYVQDTRFSVDRGYFDAPFQLEIATDTPDAQIYYTLDGQDPSASTIFNKVGQLYEGPIPVATTTVVRAHAVKPGHRASDVDTQTYLFLADVLRQTGEGLPESWNGAVADYAMDPEVVDHPDYRDTILEDFRTLPALSIVLPPDDFFSTEKGIYPGKIGEDGIEKACSAELLHPDGAAGFQVDCSVQIVGGSSVGRWKIHKLSMRLRFDGDYGASELAYPLFPDDPGAATRFQTLVVDARHNNTWAYQGGSEPVNQRARAQYLRDQFAADLQRETGGHAPRGRYVHVFIDGVYWGMYNLHERPDEHFAASYLGGAAADYDVLKHNSSSAVNGTADRYRDLHTLAGRDLSVPENYAAVEDILDLDQFIDYMLVHFATGNTDWAHQNWYASSRRDDPAGRWRYHSWDAEKNMQILNDNVVTKNDAGGPTGLHQRLKGSPDYRIRFADRVQRHFFHGGVLSTEGLRRVYARRTAEIDRAVILESARWGDTAAGVTKPYARNEHWVAQRDYLMNTYFVERPAIVLDQLKADGLSAPLLAPEFGQHGGPVEAGHSLEIRKNVFAPGDIYYTLDGSDPREPGGTLAPSAVKYAGPVALADAGVRAVRARLFRSSLFGAREWSALLEAEFLVGVAPASPENIVLSKIQYHPGPPTVAEAEAGFSADDFEFVELLERIQPPVTLHGAAFTRGIALTFGDSAAAELAPGQRLVLARNPEGFASRYGTGVEIGGQFGGGLDRGGETLRLEDRDGAVIFEFAYGDDCPWPESADGEGRFLVLRDPANRPDPSDPGSWRASRAEAGPGSGDALAYGPWIEEALSMFDGDPTGTLPGRDRDGDGWSNLLEYALGSDPAVAGSTPLFTVDRPGPGAPRLRFGRRFGVEEAVILETSEDLRTWRPLAGAEEDSCGLGSDPEVEVRAWRLDTVGGEAFYRLRVILADGQ